MKRAVLMALLGLVVISQLGLAQQANQNINVLPFPTDPAAENAQLFGDLYLQRQVEPTIVASTRNPDHLMAFFVDYRAVDEAGDSGMGELPSAAQSLLARVRSFFLELLHPAKGGELELPTQVAQSTGEAWVGCSRSYDGGLTWSGCFVPGAPFDNSPASLASPAHGLEAATDPVAWAAPCGVIHVAYIGLTRGGTSKMLVATYQDQNNVEGGDTWQYLYTSVIEVANNAEHGVFIDKPFLIVDVDRQGSGDPCAHNIYCSYSTFNGQDKNGDFRSKITFAESTDLGQSWTVDKLNPPYHQNQGTWMAVDPLDGKVYLFWRHFIDPEAILMMSANYGQGFKGQPKVITGNLDLATFDQLGIGTTTPGIANPIDDISFRSNGFPTAAVGVDPESGQTTVMVAWQERVDIESGSSFGQPDQDGSPRIVLLSSQDDGKNWFDPYGNPPEQRQAVDFGDRDQDPDLYPPPGFGALPQPRPSGPQVQPTLSCGGGRCMLTYLESGGLVGRPPNETIQEVDLSDTGFISHIDRKMDLRAALLDIADGHLLSTTQVSRYTIKAAADFSDGETLDDVEPANWPCFPDDPGALVPCRRRVHEPNKPQSGGGTTPFVGDYNYLTPVVQFVPTDDGSGWRWAIFPEDLPYQAFHAIWGGDNRNLIPPTEPFGLLEWEQYQYYPAPGNGFPCVNAGAKNTDTMTARVDADLILSSPTTYKQLEDAPHTFVLSLTNGTGSNRFYSLTITDGAESASFWSPAENQPGDNDWGVVELFPYSSTSKVVYADQDASGQIKVEVEEVADENGGILEPPGASGVITFNADSSNPVVTGLGDTETLAPTIESVEVTNPFAINPFAINPFAINPFAINASPSNPFAINPFAINPFAINSTLYEPPTDPLAISNIVDTTWTISAGGSDVASSYLALVNIDNFAAFLPNYAFQLIIYKNSGYSGLEGCDALAIPQDQVISSIVLDPENPFAINPFAINPFAINPFAINPFAINSAFTMAPSDGATAVTSGGSMQAPPNPNALTANTLAAPLDGDKIKITLRAYPLVPSSQLGDCENPDPDDLRPPCYNPNPALGGDTASLVVVPEACDPLDLDRNSNIECLIAFAAPDLIPVFLGGEPLQSDPVAAGETILFPAGGWDLWNQGNSTGTAETTILRHGFYLSTFDPVDWFELPENEGKTTSDLLAELGQPLGNQESTSNTLPANGTQRFMAANLTIPTGLTPGSYYLILWVDDRLEVSEMNEINNYELARFPIEVITPNTAPVAADDAFTIDEDDENVLLNVTSNDEDLDLNLDPASANIVSGASFGSLVNNGDGSFTYTPAGNYNGGDAFEYEVCDTGQDRDPATDLDDLCDTATVIITIDPVNDSPVANGQIVAVPEDSLAWSITLTGSDVDVDPLTFRVVSGTAFGALSGTAPNLTYTPNPNYNGLDGFAFVVNDGTVDSPPATVQITVTATPDAPVANDDFYTTGGNTFLTVTEPGVLGNDFDADANSLTAVADTNVSDGSLMLNADGSFTYDPDPYFFGTDSFKYHANDGSSDSNIAIVAIGVQFEFVGLLSPWKPNGITRVNQGSAFPITWRYADPVTGEVVDSIDADPEIRIRGPYVCKDGEDEDVVEEVFFPGNSDYRYHGGSFTHQLNWDTDGTTQGQCYKIRIFSGLTWQLDREEGFEVLIK